MSIIKLHLVMKTIIVFLSALIISGLIVRVEAQVSSKINYQPVGEFRTETIANMDTTFNLSYPDLNGTGMTGILPLSIRKSAGPGYTFNSQWKTLTGKSLIDTTKLFYSSYNAKGKPALSDHGLYRVGAGLFNAIMTTRYPYANTSGLQH
jgi:hypothetical protein